mmetsp:Transcript_17420/g.42280  ORF Transcript_17420/g.42280 Transcript_17420/m.42280 type:complete len:171 (+) Transcript_17420:92-604(+)
MGCLNSVPEEPRESAIGQTIKSCRIVRGHEEKGSDGTWQSYGHFAGFELELGNGTFFLYKAAGPDPSFTSFNIRGYEMAVGGNVKKEDFESFMQGPGVPDHPDHFCAIEQYMRNRVISTIDFNTVQYSPSQGNLRMTFDGYHERELDGHPYGGAAICKVTAQARYPPVHY